ncbi:hypothetical protein HYH03_018036 [Edaphochlamys debaryana]|uniref:Uncharacterized protein n=1 Tax=Edaphochlamys debaryana TaxID=47281 RepID=A0A835XHX4_9CHLO|nr:hypothetical protein HYH03_018036 [Edaphochlamys debaryana]|eukprot:KAG2483098.1 hypothetical protein HYH03_018036 [Edaphochlamys debaryana]
MAKKDGFGSEIERMLMERPISQQGRGGPGPQPMSTGAPMNTLDDLMAELGMLRENRGELGRQGTNGRMARASTGANDLGGMDLQSSLGRPVTPRSSAAAANGGYGGGGYGGGYGGGMGSPALGSPALGSGVGLSLPPAKGALPSMASIGGAPQEPSPARQSASALGPVRAQSPMGMRRSVAGQPGGPGAGLSAMGQLAAASASITGPPSGVMERQLQLEVRVEKMEARESQLLQLVNTLQAQVVALTKQQATHSAQLAAGPPAPHPLSSGHPAAARAAPAAAAPAAAAKGGAAAAPAAHVSDEDFIQDDNEASDDESRQKDAAAKAPPAAAAGATGAAAGGSKPVDPRQPQPVPPAGAKPAAAAAADKGRPAANKLNPSTGPAADWEADVGQLRKEMGALATNVARIKTKVDQMVPGGASPLAEEVAVHGQAAEQLKGNLTQLAMDVVALHKSLQTLKSNTDKAHTVLEKSIQDVAITAQQGAVNMLAGGGGGMDPSGGHVAQVLANTGGVSGSLEDSLRNAFAKPAMRPLPQFNSGDAGFMPDNAGALAAAANFGGGPGGPRPPPGGPPPGPPGAQGQGLGAAWALLNSFEEQAQQEQHEAQKAAVIAKQAMGVVDAKVKQVIMHVDRHMQAVQGDIENRLGMYEQTIIRMAKQIDAVQKAMRELEAAAGSRIVVKKGGKEIDDLEALERRRFEEETRQKALAEAEAQTVQTLAKANWVKAAAMATGRFVPQKEEKKEEKKVSHGYFQGPK